MPETASQYVTADKPETTAAFPVSQEIVVENNQNLTPNPNTPPHTGVYEQWSSLAIQYEAILHRAVAAASCFTPLFMCVWDGYAVFALTTQNWPMIDVSCDTAATFLTTGRRQRFASE